MRLSAGLGTECTYSPSQTPYSSVKGTDNEESGKGGSGSEWREGKEREKEGA